MSASPTFMQGLLQSLQPWMTGSSPSALDTATSQYGGTGGLLSAMMQGAGPDTTQARQGAALQNARALALQQAGQRQQLASGAIQSQLMQSKLPAMQAYYRMLTGMIGGSPGGAPPVNSPPVNAPPGNAPPMGATPPPSATSGANGISPRFDAASQTAPSATPQAPGTGGLFSDPMNAMRFGALGGALGLPGGQQFFDYGKTALQYDPATATKMALAKDPLTLDKAQMQEATQANDPQGYVSAYTKMLTDANRLHISSMSGNVTGFGLPPWVLQSMANYNPQSGKITAGGRQSLIPGAADTEAALEAARAGAERKAQLSAETAPAGSGAAPIVAPPQGGTTKAPQAPRGQSPSQSMVAPQGFQGADAVRQENFIPPILAAPSKIAQAPGNTSLGQLQVVQKEQAEKASELAGQWNEQADAAQQLITQADQIQAAARDFTPGRYAETKGEVMSALQGLPGNWLSPDQTKALGSYQEGQKLSIQLQATVTKQLGNREAAQVFSVMGKSIPNLTLSSDGLGKIGAYLEGIARYQQARNTFGQRLITQGNVAAVNGLTDNLVTHSNPIYYILSSAPPKVAQELIGNMAPSERGKVQAGWKQAISMGLAPAPGDYN